MARDRSIARLRNKERIVPRIGGYSDGRAPWRLAGQVIAGSARWASAGRPKSGWNGHSGASYTLDGAEMEGVWVGERAYGAEKGSNGRFDRVGKGQLVGS